MNNSVVVSVKMPRQLKQRIDILARKGLTTRNHWIVKTLTRHSASYKEMKEHKLKRYQTAPSE